MRAFLLVVGAIVLAVAVLSASVYVWGINPSPGVWVLRVVLSFCSLLVVTGLAMLREL